MCLSFLLIRKKKDRNALIPLTPGAKAASSHTSPKENSRQSESDSPVLSRSGAGKALRWHRTPALPGCRVSRGHTEEFYKCAPAQAGTLAWSSVEQPDPAPLSRGPAARREGGRVTGRSRRSSACLGAGALSTAFSCHLISLGRGPATFQNKVAYGRKKKQGYKTRRASGEQRRVIVSVSQPRKIKCPFWKCQRAPSRRGE